MPLRGLGSVKAVPKRLGSLHGVGGILHGFYDFAAVQEAIEIQFSVLLEPSFFEKTYGFEV